jgi:hypothetical protein
MGNIAKQSYQAGASKIGVVFRIRPYYIAPLKSIFVCEIQFLKKSIHGQLHYTEN